MNAIWTLAKKDLLLLWRDKVSMFWMFGMPLIFAAFFGSIFGGSGPGKSNPLGVAVIEEGLTPGARRFVERLDASEAVAVEYMPREKARDAVRRGRKLAYLDVKSAPDEDLGIFAGEAPVVEIGIDPSRQAEQGLLQGLVNEAMFSGTGVKATVLDIDSDHVDVLRRDGNDGRRRSKRTRRVKWGRVT